MTALMSGIAVSAACVASAPAFPRSDGPAAFPQEIIATSEGACEEDAKTENRREWLRILNGELRSMARSPEQYADRDEEWAAPTVPAIECARRFALHCHDKGLEPAREVSTDGDGGIELRRTLDSGLQAVFEADADGAGRLLHYDWQAGTVVVREFLPRPLPPKVEKLPRNG